VAHIKFFTSLKKPLLNLSAIGGDPAPFPHKWERLTGKWAIQPTGQDIAAVAAAMPRKKEKGALPKQAYTVDITPSAAVTAASKAAKHATIKTILAADKATGCASVFKAALCSSVYPLPAWFMWSSNCPVM